MPPRPWHARCCFRSSGRSGVVSLTVESAQARVGRPLTPVSVAGVARRTTRRAYYGAAAVGAAAAGTAYYYGQPSLRLCLSAWDVFPRRRWPEAPLPIGSIAADEAATRAAFAQSRARSVIAAAFVCRLIPRGRRGRHAARYSGRNVRVRAQYRHPCLADGRDDPRRACLWRRGKPSTPGGIWWRS